jgi:group I intron endonuclease
MADFNLTPKPYGYIYVITNTVNGKVYVGQTTLTIAERWYGHQHQARKEKRNTAICHAICKYGVDAFKVSEIGVAHSQDELNLLEMYWVAQYNSMDRQTGYNMRGGGDGGGRHSEEVRQKISAAGMGKPAPNKGKPMPERQRIQLAERMRTDNPRTGTVHSEYSKRKISESNKGKHHIKHDPKDVKRRAELLRTKYMGMSPERASR